MLLLNSFTWLKLYFTSPNEEKEEQGKFWKFYQALNGLQNSRCDIWSTTDRISKHEFLQHEPSGCRCCELWILQFVFVTLYLILMNERVNEIKHILIYNYIYIRQIKLQNVSSNHQPEVISLMRGEIFLDSLGKRLIWYKIIFSPFKLLISDKQSLA